MENKEENIVADDLFYVRIYKDGRVERLLGTTIAPPSTDTKGPVLSKDIVISHEPPISARLYLPNNPPPTSSKLPVVVYFHGGAFIFESAMSVDYQKHLETLAAEARVIIVSVEYRLAPEHPIPAAYDDSWVAVQWVGSHSDGQGPEEWLNDYADLTRVFFAGESAGANIAHRMGLRVGERIASGNGLELGFKLLGAILVQPYFWGNDPLPNETTDPKIRIPRERRWRLANPTTTGCDDPYLNPAKDPGIRMMGCSRVLAYVAEKDDVRERGLYYKELMEKSGWKGEVELMESKGEDHVFHLFKPSCDNALALIRDLSEFIHRG